MSLPELASSPPSTLASDLSAAFPGLIASADPADRVAYSRDFWPRHHLAVRAGNVAQHRPGLVVWPRTTEEVAGIVRYAYERGIPLVPFGAGSGVCAGVLPTEQAIIVDLKRMERWRKLDRDAPTLDVEAGHMGLVLEEKLQREGYTVGNFPSSILCSTVGGWLAARSAGQCSGFYGKIEDMVPELECVTGTGDVVVLKSRVHGPSLVPLVIGSEGTMAIITSATLRLHPAPTSRGFGAWSFPTTELGMEAMRAIFQAGLRPAVSRLYDPFDAMLARMGAVKAAKPKGEATLPESSMGPGVGTALFRQILRRPEVLNDLLDSELGTRVLGGAMLVLVFEGTGQEPQRGVDRARELLAKLPGRYEGEGPAQKWLKHRYSISYRMAPMFSVGGFADTMEVATTWEKLPGLFQGVRKALSEHAFVMAHFSHAYPDGCAIYFTFAGSAAPDAPRGTGWDTACETTFDRAWQAAMAATLEAGGALAHHHGVGRSKAPRIEADLGAGVSLIAAVQRAFDPKGILNPGNLSPTPAPEPYLDDAHVTRPT